MSGTGGGVGSAMGGGALPPVRPKRKRKKKSIALSRVTDPLVYGLVRGLAGVVQVAGVDRSMHAMRSLGGRFARLPLNRERIRRAEENLRWCFPDWSEDRVSRCAVEAYRHLFSLAVEISAAPRLLAGDSYSAHVEFSGLEEGLGELLRERPVVLVSGHCGNWEVLGTVLAVLGVHINALYRPLDLKALDDWVRRTRAARGMNLIDKFGGTRAIPGLMERNAAVAFIADQNAGDRGLFVPYFDRLASAYKAIGVSAMRFDAAVVCGQAVRLTGGEESEVDASGSADGSGSVSQMFRYRVEVTDVIRPEDWREQPDPLFYITARYRRALETMVRSNPEQYLWMHRYWKSRPRHEREQGGFPGRLREKIESLPWMTEERVERIVERSAVDAARYAEDRRMGRRR